MKKMYEKPVIITHDKIKFETCISKAGCHPFPTYPSWASPTPGPTPKGKGK
jgi:hypothetical protein